MNKNVEVVIEKCSSYDREEVRQAVSDTCRKLGGLQRWVKPGDKVLLKVNLLSPVSPDRAVTTHPELVRAVAEEVLSVGGQVIVGDSSGGIVPGDNWTAKALEKAGINKLASELPIQAVNFDTAGVVRYKNPRGGKYEDIYISKAVDDADVVITIPKLKTHTLTVFTGAVKNMYGCVPGGRKAFYHKVAPSVPEFSGYLVDVFEKSRPHLAIMDAIIGMEGDGPSAGSPRKIHAIIASCDSVAVDSVACSLVGINPTRVEMLVQAQARNLGMMDLSKISIIGPFESLKLSDFKAKKQSPWIPAFLGRKVLSWWQTYPIIDQEKCIMCKICYNSCPIKIITDNGQALLIDHKRCIQCYCCHELCPKHAIFLKSSPIARLVQRLRGR